MGMAVDQTLLDRIAASLRTSRASLSPDPTSQGDISSGEQPAGANKHSILSRAAELYGARSATEDTPKTGFDPAAAALFEALVEGAFLVAHADGEFDDDERAAFQEVVLAATDSNLGPDQLVALLADLTTQLGEDGFDKRLEVIVGTVGKVEQQREILRVAALIGHISGGVSDVERAVMQRLSDGFGLDPGEVDRAIVDATGALGD